MKNNPFLLLAASLSLAMIFTFSCSGDGNVIDSISNSGGSEVWDGRINTTWYDDSKKEFTITTAQQLAGLAKLVNDGAGFAGKTVKLGKTINLSKIEWTPIGNCEVGFTGIFDGNGYEIIGVSVNNPDSSCQGFFRGLEYGGEIKNLGIVDSYIRGNEEVGGIAGYNNSKISNSYFTGAVAGANMIGGLVGFNYPGTISNSYSTGTIAGDTAVGGLVGYNYQGTINNSYSKGTVSGNVYIGGLAGLTYQSTISNSYSTSTVVSFFRGGGFVGHSDGEISNSYSTGAVTGDSIVGGFVGVNFGEISNSYSTGAVKGDTVAGGFVGWNNVGASMSNNYSIGKVSGYINVGGFVGFNSGEISNSYSAGTVSGLAGMSGTLVVLGGFAGGSRTGIGSVISNSFYDKEKNSQIESYGGTGKTTAQMKEQATYTDWDFSKVWGLSSTVNSGYPYLRSVVGSK